MKTSMAAVGLVALSILGCAQGSGGGSGGGSVSAGASVAGGPLAAKARLFDETVAARHMPDGLLVNLELDAAGNVVSYGNYYDACIWTGVYVGTEAVRYRTTGDPAALARMERGLVAMHHLQAITGEPGYVARAFGPAAMHPTHAPGTGPYAGQTWQDDTSRDQYVGLMFGYALAWESIVDPVLRSKTRDDVRAIALRLMRDDMEVRVVRNGTQIVHFRLAPGATFKGKITPQTWATVDDFPLNLVVKHVSYDPALATALENAPWPAIGGGDAFHGLVFFRIAATITGDPAIEDFYRNVLIAQRGYVQNVEENINLFEDLLAGRRLDRFERILLDINAALSGAVQVYLQPRLGALSPLGAALIQYLFDAILKVVADVVADSIRFLNDPASRAQAGRTAVGLEALALLLDAIGEHDPARSLRSLARIAGTVATTNLEELADTMRSYVGENLFHLSSYAALTLETDATLRAFYAAQLDRKGAIIGDEKNSFFDFVGAAYGAGGPDPVRIAEARRSLEVYPTDLFDHALDNSRDPGVRVSPWPDRFGKVGNTALDVFPVDRRSPHHFVWQQHPRDIISTPGSSTQVTHLGYLTAYWIGRAHGFINPGD
jgi:hypothetical protein